MWARVEYPTEVYHVIPVDDIRDHEQCDCWCKPTVERVGNGRVMISHNAGDFREFYQEEAPTGH